MDPPPARGQQWTPSMEASPAQSESSFEEEDEHEEQRPRGLGMLLVTPRAYSSSESDDVDGRSADSVEDDEDDDEDMSAASAVLAMGVSPPQQVMTSRSVSIDDMELSLESLRLLAQHRGLDTTGLSRWSVREDGKLLDAEQHKYRSLRDALRAYTHLLQGAIPREDMYYLAILRRKLADMELPLVDGPISVVALGSVVPEEHFYTSKKLFPIGYETLVNVQVMNPVTVAFRLRCKIVHGNKKKSPIFVVELESSAYYQFWEQRHPITPDVHAKIRSRLKGQVKDVLQAQNVISKDDINRLLSQEDLLEEYSHNPEEVQRIKEKEQREADKRSVREAARKLLEIEMKAQEDAKEAQRRAKEERKNAILEAKIEAARQKEARKEALRLAREEEKRMREEEKEIKRALREEEKRKKIEEKEHSMKRRIEELRQRRQMREEQKAILENGVVTSSSPRRSGDSRKRKAVGGVPDIQAVRQQHLVLLKFVEEERERRRQIRVWNKKNEVETLPSLSVFVSMMALSDGSSPVGDGDLDDDSIELARQVCQLAMEFKHPSADEQLLKAIKGSKSYRDDAVTHPLRQKLHRRGTNLLKGVQFQEEEEEVEVEPHNSHGKNSITLASEANAPAGSSDYYGVVLVDGVSSKFKVGEKDEHLVVTEVIATENDASSEKVKVYDGATAGQRDDNADRVRVGDYLLCINGQDVREMPLEDFSNLLNGLSTPHGLLMSSVVPAVKNTMKHIATTQGATKMKCCGFVLKVLRAKEIAAPFNQPVDAELYPDYYSSGDIVEPMDLGTISEKIEDEDYENDDVESFVDDVQLVWRNCYSYNSLKAEISNLAQKLSVIFERLMKEWVYTTVNRPMIAAEEDNCRSCQTIHAKGRLLLCDRCDAPYHTFCLESPLPVIPKGEWFCPACLADPSFSPEQFRRKSHDDMVAGADDSLGGSDLKENDLTELEKRLLSAIDLLSQENYSKITISERLKVLRVLCELIEETAAVQSVYHSLEEKANDRRKKLGDSLADLEREWDRFIPPRSSHGVEQTKKFIIDGVEHELTDELLTYLEKKAKADLEAKPVPILPESAQKQLRGDADSAKEGPVALIADEDDGTSSDGSEAEEEMILEEFGDRYLVASVGSAEMDEHTDSVLTL
uniref:PHD-type domain-containing protein n=1 Tax=Phytophthora ramorum TaxID=164328 RepID=H3GKB6_PHYRM